MRRAVVAAVVAVVMALAACTSSGGSGTDPAGDGQAEQPSEPDRPDDERTDDGAIAFAGYVFEVVAFAYGTADPAPLEDIADLELCSGCMQPLEAIAAASSDSLLASGAEVATSDGQVVDDSGARTTVQLRVQFPEVAPAGPTGETLAATDAPMQVTLRWDATRWTLVDFAPIGN